MIVVDIFADLYDWEEQDRERVLRTARAAKTIYTVARRGAAAAPPLAFVDAALSVLDAVNAYAGYRRAKEVTRQLEIEGEMLRKLLNELHEQLKINARIEDERFAQEANALRARLKRQAIEFEMTMETFNSLSKQVKKLGQTIVDLRRNAPPNCTHLLRLEQAYFGLVDLHLQTIMDAVKE
jgi:hypothetical protein